MAAKNANDALGLLKVIENATNDITNMLQRIRELMVQAGGLVEDNPSDRDHKNLQSVADELITEITRISSTATYNSKALLGADTSSINIQVGYNGGDQIALKTYSGSASSLGLRSASILAEKKLRAYYSAIVASAAAGDDAAQQLGSGLAANFAITNAKLLVSASIATIDSAIDKVSAYRAQWSESQNRLEYTVSNLMNVVEFTTAARSRIEDADFAVESAKLATAQVLQKIAAAMLAQANAAPQLALQLIKQL